MIRNKQVPLSLVLGSGDIDDIIIPSDIPPGDYIIEIADGVLPSCVYDANTNTNAVKSNSNSNEDNNDCITNDVSKLRPGDIENMYKVVEPLESFRIPVKIVGATI